MHSVPKYPAIQDDKIMIYIPGNAYEYGQNFFCVSLQIHDINALKKNIATAKLHAFYTRGTFSNISTISESDDKADNYTINNFTLTNGGNVTLLSKSPYSDKYLYEDIVEPYFGIGLMVESWGRPYMKPNCQPNSHFDSTNVVSIKLSNGDSWSSEDDHAKWAISYADQEEKIFCSCDMNRMVSQIKRGGSALCIRNTKLYNAFKSIVSQYSRCSNNSESIESSLEGNQANKTGEYSTDSFLSRVIKLLK